MSVTRTVSLVYGIVIGEHIDCEDTTKEVVKYNEDTGEPRTVSVTESKYTFCGKPVTEDYFIGEIKEMIEQANNTELEIHQCVSDDPYADILGIEVVEFEFGTYYDLDEFIDPEMRERVAELIKEIFCSEEYQDKLDVGPCIVLYVG